MYNRIFVFEPPDRDDLAAAIAWLVGRQVPFGVFVADDAAGGVEESAEDLDIERMDASFPGMALPSLGDVPPGESDADIVAVADDADFEDFRTVLTAVPEFPTDVESVMPASIRDEDAIDLYVGRIGGRPGVCGWLGRTEDVAGVYGIGVREEFRRQGIGAAMTRHVLGAGRNAGCEAAVLQSTPMAISLYETLEFETVTTYHIFTISS